MKDMYEILELFPTPIYATKIPDSYSKITTHLFKEEMLSEEVDEVNYGQRSKDSYILNKDYSINLQAFILDHIYKFCNEILMYDYSEYRFSQSWVSCKLPGQHHTMHTHPNSLISGVFYFGQPTNNTPTIKFHKTSASFNANYISPKIKFDVRSSKFAHNTFSINFEPGLLLLFPSYLSHSVPLNKTNEPRYSLAFNVVPKIGFGDERNLTELKF